MKNQLFLFGVILTTVIAGCNNGSQNTKALSKKAENGRDISADPAEKSLPVAELKQEPEDFLPEGHVIFDKIYGDLNKDGIKDLVLIIKGTDKNNFVKDEYRGELDRNRRGIMIFFKKDGGYELVLKNTDCFSSENENGGVYFAPELSVSAEKGKLYVHYAHGRYGYWRYTFRHNKTDFELIGYDSSNNHGPIVESTTSINFLTGKKQEKQNVSEDPENEEVFKETWEDLKNREMIRLSEIDDFDELTLPE